MTNSTTSSSKVSVPEAREAMNKFKYEVASEIGVPLKQGYNGDLTSAQNGYVGGYMVNKMTPERHKQFYRRLKMRGMPHLEVNYTYSVVFDI